MVRLQVVEADSRYMSISFSLPSAMMLYEVAHAYMVMYLGTLGPTTPPANAQNKLCGSLCSTLLVVVVPTFPPAQSHPTPDSRLPTCRLVTSAQSQSARTNAGRWNLEARSRSASAACTAEQVRATDLHSGATGHSAPQAALETGCRCFADQSESADDMPLGYARDRL